MKYWKYLGVILFTVFRKVFGLFWFWLILPFRGYARNVVYNYTLQNNIWLKRLYERNPIRVEGGWELTGGRVEKGFIRFKDVTWLEYQFMYWLVWIWVDDDSNRDVTDLGYIRTYLDGERKTWFSRDKLLKEYNYLSGIKFGNTFELGDLRAEYPVEIFKSWRCTLLWLKRNTGYNAKYSQFETINKKDVFRIDFKDKIIGWVEEGVVNGKQNYSLRFLEGED